MSPKPKKGSGAIAAILAAGGRGTRFAGSAGGLASGSAASSASGSAASSASGSAVSSASGSAAGSASDLAYGSATGAAPGSESESPPTPPKQFLQLRGKPVYVWPLRVLLQHKDIVSIVVTMPPELVTVAAMEAARLMDEVGETKELHIIGGGTSRQESVWLGLEVLSKLSVQPEYVLVHDAARPFLTPSIVDAVVEGVRATGACTVGHAPTDTVKKVNDGVIAETIDRSALQMVQTPQAGRMDWLLAGHRDAREKSIATTDDAAILESAGHKVSVVPGSSLNLKVTTKQDLELCDAIFGIATGHPL